MIESLGYLISTHVAYQQPLARLLESMRSIDPSRVLVVSGGHARRAIVVAGGIVHVQVTHNSFDYTAIIEFVERKWVIADHLFLLHDTMELGPDADARIRTADPSHKATAVWGGQCNLMLCRADYLFACQTQLFGLRDCSKRYAVEMEGFLWRQLPEGERGSYLGGLNAQHVRPVYGGAPRQCEYYSGVDIIKYKANWGQSWPEAVVIP